MKALAGCKDALQIAFFSPQPHTRPFAEDLCHDLTLCICQMDCSLSPFAWARLADGPVLQSQLALQAAVSRLVLTGRCTRKALDSPYTPCWQQAGVRWPGCGCDNPARRSCPGQRYDVSGGTGAPPSQTGATQLCSWVGPRPVWCWASLRPPLCGLSRGEGLPGPRCWPEEA